MAAPPKPWERVNYQNNPSLPSNSMAGVALNGDSVHSAVGGVGVSPVQTSTSPPQLPPRPSQQSSYPSRFSSGNLGYGGGYGGYSNMYGGGYSSLSNPYSMGGYGSMYNSPYSSYGGQGPHNANSSFARQAEESTRPAFESIESIVHAVSSVGMMLDSTFSAVYSSFRAVIGVADNFARLKSQLVQVFSALAFIRTLRYMFRKLLELIRLRPQGEAETEWRNAFNAAAAAATSHGGDPKRSSWPILLFFGIIMGGPYLIWKLISKFSGEEDQGWAKGREDHFVAKANFNFHSQGSEELSFSAGQEIRIAPKELQPRVRGWLLGSVDGSTVGLIPANYVTVLGKKRGHQQQSQPQSQQLQGESQQSTKVSSPYSVLTNPQMETMDYESDFNSYFNNSNGQNEVNRTIENTSDQEAADILDEADKC